MGEHDNKSKENDMVIEILAMLVIGMFLRQMNNRINEYFDRENKGE